MGFFKNFLKSAGNIVGGVFSKIPVIGGIGDAIVSEVGRQDAKDQLKSEQNWASNQAQINRDFQREERELTQQWELEQWQREMDYNSPANQIKLAMEAGINPNSIVDAGGNFSPTSAPSSSPMSGSMASSPASLANSLLLHDPHTANLIANTRKVNAEAEGKELENSYAPQLNETMIAKARAEIDEIASKKGFTDEQTRQLKDLFPLLKGKNEQELKKLQQETSNMFEQLKLIQAQARSANAQADYDEWAKEFREKYGVSPNSGLIDGIIQLATSGDKGVEIVDALLETGFSTLYGVITAPVRLPYKKLKERIGEELMPLPPYAGSELAVPPTYNP